MWFIKFMQKRPSDTAIRISRITFGLIYLWAMYYNLIYQGDAIDSNMFWMEFSDQSLEYFKYGFTALWIVPIYMWVSNICLLKKKHMRYVQGTFWIVLFYISSTITETPTLDVDSLVAFMGIFPFFAGITGKCITTNCMKYKEKITKIRV